jgi:uncharacterized phage protein (TIGR01671 family)
MDKEIRFRAWDKKDCKMYYSDVPKQNYKVTPYGIFANDTHNYQYTSYTLFGKEFTKMQYTGLKDKNGVDIYEGDVLKQFGNPKPFVVEFFNSTWRARRLYILGSEIKEPSIEVIGNIYENPERLSPNK